MRNTFLSAAIAMAVCGVVHADVVTFTPFDIAAISPAYIYRMSPNGAFLSGTDSSGATGFRYNVTTGQADLLSMYPNNVTNTGTLVGWLPVNGGTPNGGTDLGAYVPLGSDPIAITNPMLEDSDAYGMSDGGTVVGLSTTKGGTPGIGSAYTWTAAAGMKMLPVNRPVRAARANGISQDGHIIYGWNDDLTGFRTGTIWVDGAPLDIGYTPSMPNAGEADGISANDQFVVGSNAYNSSFVKGGWRWNRADNSVIYIPDMAFVFAVSNDGKTIIGNADYAGGPLRVAGGSDAEFGKAISSDAEFSTVGGGTNASYNERAALIWHEGIGTMRLVDWITANGGTVPAGFNADLAGSALNMTGDGTFMNGWATNSMPGSYTVNVTPDKLFADRFDGTSLGVFATLSPSTILAQSAQGAPARLTIDLDNPGKSDATLSSDFIDQLPFGLIIAATPNTSNSCSSDPLVAYAGYDTITLHAGAVIPAGAHCVISLAVTANLSGTYQNVIPAGSLLADAGQNRTDSNSSLTVVAGGNGVVHSATLNHVMVDSATGSTVNWVLGTFSDTGPTSGSWDLNLRDTSGLTFRTVKTYMDGLAVDTSNNVIVMHAGDVVGPSTYFTYAATATAFLTPSTWLAGTDGYVGFRFLCDKPRQANKVAGGFCYGYMHLTTTAGATGYPVTLVSYAFDGDGKAITVGQ
ncbi:hypothetical protein ELE36_13040 [Pseudolysobacter antarcticus]|uniref:DUF7933 domain-containing protein n=1 Tax=Pseudolysobacter antarcticus TaxID=2511995 RepID=A0A411HL31_9GAMM|nr:hypothetical protein [Pseudolysobacter antarcticus]QBB71203.1 hypothetical protein ELE36_13040 [Pseudolysobacter antarcticus]